MSVKCDDTHLFDHSIDINKLFTFDQSAKTCYCIVLFKQSLSVFSIGLKKYFFPFKKNLAIYSRELKYADELRYVFII